MKASIAWPIIAIVVLGATGAALAAEPGHAVRIEVARTEMHPGMAPGSYVCGEGHLHIKGTVQNLAAVPVGPIKVAGKVFDANGKLLGTATASTKRAVLNPNDKADINLEFLTVTGPLIERVKSQELTVVAVGVKP
ncbi:MAG: FxLYD domain-containing protein [Casimicrobiaceae bacterium]